MKIAFHDNQLCERGTTVALYDYAHHNETILGNSASLRAVLKQVAKIIPHRVRQVITIGSPIARVAHSTNVGWLYQWLHGGPATMDRRLAKNLRTPPPVPTTSIYSRSDGVVAWKACLEAEGPMTENVEVDSSHLGLVWHPDVLAIVAERLSQTAGTWAPRRSSSSSATQQAKAA